MRLAALTVVSFLVSPSSASAVGASLVDDRGLPIQAPMRACFVRGVDTKCIDAPPWETPDGFSAFETVTFEGDDHGPLEMHGPLPQVVRVPRKAIIQVKGVPPDGSVTAALYERKDTTFKRPMKELDLRDGKIRIPASPTLLALRASGAAPNLHLLAPKPGESSAVTYRRAPGWSLVVRCLARGSRNPVATARVTLEGPKTAGKPDVTLRSDSEKDGLAIFDPVSPPFVNLAGKAHDLLDATEHGIGAPAGSLIYREMVFDRGGAVEASVLIDGTPAPAIQCLLLSRTATRKPEGSLVPEPDVLSNNRTDSAGTCKTRRARQGSYIFRVVPASGGSGHDEDVDLREGEVTPQDIELSRIKIQGTVTKAKEPLAGAVVVAALFSEMPHGESRSTFPEPLMATTDADGHYSGYVWTKGTYSFELMSRKGGTSAADRDEWVGSDGATVDFDLRRSGVEGVVVDGDGTSVEAHVTLMQPDDQGNVNNRYGVTDAQGRFQFGIEGSHSVELLAWKKGYKTSDRLTVELDADTETAPVTLVLERLDSMSGRLVGANGSPVPGATVASYTARGNPIRQGDGVTDGDGKFLVPRAPAGASTRIFVTGQGCPLQAASFGPEDDDVVVTCGADYAALNLKLEKPDMHPLQDEWVFLRWNGVVIPRLVLMSHFAQYAIPWTTDGDGTLAVVGLSPGDYDLYLGHFASEATIMDNQRYGYLGSTHADAGSTTDLELQFGVGPHLEAQPKIAAR